MDKAPDAYRTISEVGEDLDIAQHVLRFWETRFPQIKPLKRGGGRRYYRPDDVELLKGIRHLLYREGYTIKGVQRILKEQGAKAVQAVGRAGELIPGLGPASPDDSHEDFLPASPQFPSEPTRMPAASAFVEAASGNTGMPHYGQHHPAYPAPALAPGLQVEAGPPSPAPVPPSLGSAPSRAEDGQVSYTRGGLAARPAFMPVPEPETEPLHAPAEADPRHSALANPPVSGPAARKALLDALNELEAARAAIGQVLANRDRLSSD